MSETQIRFDTIQFPKMSFTHEGYLRGKAAVTRSGVFDYHVRKELRHPDEVFKEDSLKTLKMIPVTDDHPSEMVDASNASRYNVGYTGEHYDVKSNAVIVTLTITNRDVIDKIKAGKHQVSMGYTCDVVEERGRFDGLDYSHKQKNIVYNHLAIVDRGRAGSNIRLRFDSALISKEEIKNIITEEKNMSDEKNTEELQLKLDTAIAQQVAKDKEIELLSDKIKQAQLKIDSLEKSNIKLTDELNAEKSKRTDELIAGMVVERVDLLARAADVLEIEAYIHHSDRDIRIAAINAKQKTDEAFSGVDDAYIKGRFDALLGSQSKSKVDHNVFKVLHRKHNDSANPSSGSNYFDMLSEARKNISKR
jgi:hypothetical protein